MNPSRAEDYRLDQVDLELMCGPLEPEWDELFDEQLEGRHLLTEHNATRKPVALISQRSETHA